MRQNGMQYKLIFDILNNENEQEKRELVYILPKTVLSQEKWGSDCPKTRSKREDQRKNNK